MREFEHNGKENYEKGKRSVPFVCREGRKWEGVQDLQTLLVVNPDDAIGHNNLALPGNVKEINRSRFQTYDVRHYYRCR